MYKNAKKGFIFILTRKGYEKTPSHVKSERKIGKSVKGFENRVPDSWVNNGWVEEKKIGNPRKNNKTSGTAEERYSGFLI